MPEPKDIDESDFVIEDRESPFPVDDREMIDAIYRVNLDIHSHLVDVDWRITEMYKGYKTLRFLAECAMWFLVGAVIGLAIVSVLEVL
jgi:hypothetical protein